MPPRFRCVPARFGPVLVALLLQCVSAIRSRAENRVDYRYEDYIEDDGRIHIRTHAVHAEQALNARAVVKGNFVYDGISGATPTGAAAAPGTDRLPLQSFEDLRRAGSVELGLTTGRFITRPQVSYSEESDYRSVGLSLNESIEFNQKNTILNLGVSRNFDQVTGFWLRNRTIWKDKDTWDGLVGVTQLLGPKTYLTANVSVGVADGYLTDPYKGVHFRYDFPVDGYNADPSAAVGESRPDQRVKQVGYLGVTHFVDRLNGSVDANYRLHHDDWGIWAHTAAIQWNQKIGETLMISPLARYHLQSAADFYAPVFNGTLVDPNGVNAALQSDGSLIFEGEPGFPGGGQVFSVPAWPQHYSADYRLSHLQTWTFGVGVHWQVHEHVSIDLAYKRYLMQGLDGVTLSSAYPQANVFTMGVGFQW
jgi:opacity protein-like surface antigen